MARKVDKLMTMEAHALAGKVALPGMAGGQLFLLCGRYRSVLHSRAVAGVSGRGRGGRTLWAEHVVETGGARFSAARRGAARGSGNGFVRANVVGFSPGTNVNPEE